MSFLERFQAQSLLLDGSQRRAIFLGHGSLKLKTRDELAWMEQKEKSFGGQALPGALRPDRAGLRPTSQLSEAV